MLFGLGEANLAVDLGKRLAGEVSGLSRAVLHNALQVGLVGHEAVKFRVNRCQGIGHDFANGQLKVAVTKPVK